MKQFLFSFIAVWVFALVYAKLIYEKFETNFNPEYATIDHSVTVRDGEQYVDMDVNIHKDLPSALMHTVILSKKNDEEYKELMRFGPFDPCSIEITQLAAHTQKHEEHLSKHGNMSLGSICPFKKGYYYTRDMKVDFTEDLPPQMTPGQYKINMHGTTQENGQEVQVMDEISYLRIE